MLRVSLILIALAALLVGCPASASASASGETVFPGQQPTSDELVIESVSVGNDFWHARGVEPCADPAVMVADDLNGPDLPSGESAFERAAGCQIWLLRWIVRAADQRTRLGLTNLCRVMVHAMGHTAGLGHSRTGVMAPSIDLTTTRNTAVPWSCRAWARDNAIRH